MAFDLKPFKILFPLYMFQLNFVAAKNMSLGVNRRAILSRLGVETASNSFHLSMSPSSVLTGGIWSVLHGYDL